MLCRPYATGTSIQRNLDAALEAAEAGLAEAARQISLCLPWQQWQPAARFALYTLKAMAFIQLRREALGAARLLGA